MFDMNTPMNESMNESIFVYQNKLTSIQLFQLYNNVDTDFPPNFHHMIVDLTKRCQR